MCSLAPHAAAVAPAPHRSDRTAGADVPTAATTAQKRGRDLDPASSALRVRMDAELVAVQSLVKKAKLLPRSVPAPAGKKRAPPRSEPAAGTPSKKQQPSEGADKKITSEASKPAAATSPSPAKQQSSEAAENKKKTTSEASTERKKFRQMLDDMEKTAPALRDETIYPEDLVELGIAPFEHAMTRTWNQARADFQRMKARQRAAGDDRRIGG